MSNEPVPEDGVYVADRSVPGVPLATSWCLAGTPDAIGFIVSQPIRLLGIGVYGGQGQYECRAAIRRDTVELQSVTTQFMSNDAEIVRILFPNPVVLEANAMYIASALLTGWGSWYCKGCDPHLFVSGRVEGDSSLRSRVEFTFVDAPPPTNGTKVDGGQIPALFFKFLP